MSYPASMQRRFTPQADCIRTTGDDAAVGSKEVVKDLWTAATEGDVDCIAAHIALGHDVNRMGQPDEMWGPRYEKASMFTATPLHFACGYGREAAVKILLAAGAQPMALSGSGVTCYEYAKRRGYGTILQLLDQSRHLQQRGATVAVQEARDATTAGGRGIEGVPPPSA